MLLKPRFRLRAILQSTTVFVLLVVLIHLAIHAERQSIADRLHSQVSQQAVAKLARLQVELYANIFLAAGLTAYINEGNEVNAEKMQASLKSVYKLGRHIRNIGLAPGNRLTYVYPLQGNESAIGLYYPDFPEQWQAIKRVIKSRQTVLAGPVPLRQGGEALINRTPVFLDNGEYWGILSIVLDTTSLMSAAGLNTGQENINFALRGRDGLAENGEVFFGDPQLFDGDSLKFLLPVPGGAWQMAVRPVAGWSSGQEDLIWGEAIAVAIAFLLFLAQLKYHTGMARLAENERQLRLILDTTHDGVIVINDQGLIVEFNSAAEQLFGYSESEIKGTTVNRLMPAEVAADHNQFVWHSRVEGPKNMAPGRHVMGRTRDGHEFPIEITVGKASSANGIVYVGVVRDISERKAFEEKLLKLANTDSLTGALSRRAFLQAADNAFRISGRHDRGLSVLVIDVDFFKKINDSYGHAIGDLVLINLVGMFNTSFRDTDRIGRFGGEEFVVLLPETSLHEAIEVAERLLDSIRQNEEVIDDVQTLKYTVSIGVATITEVSENFEAILKAADHALYRAKEEGRDRYCVAH